MSGQDEETMEIVTNGKLKAVLKAVTLVLLLTGSIILAIWQSAAYMIRESGVSASQIEQNKAQIEQIRAEYVQKETYSTQMTDFNRRLERIENNQEKMLQLMLEQRRR